MDDCEHPTDQLLSADLINESTILAANFFLLSYDFKCVLLALEY